MTVIKVNNPKFKPTCPMCGNELEGCGFPLPKKGKGMCPAGMMEFDFELEVDETEGAIKKDKDGNISKSSKWKVSGDTSKHA